MKEQTNHNKRNRNTALVFIGAGIFLLLQHTFGFFAVIAVMLILIGIHRVRSHMENKGYVLIVLGAIILLGDHLFFIIAIILISLGYFYIKSRQLHKGGDYFQKQTLVESIRLGKDPWILKNSSIWFVVGEFTMDLSLAIFEQKETTLILQGVIGDVDIIVPEDVGIWVTSSVILGQIDVSLEKEAGVLKKLVWQSPNYSTCEHQVKLMISYIVGDIDIKFM